MFNSITGTVSGSNESYLFLQTPSIEWSILVPISVLTKIQVGAEARIYTYLSHSQDSMSLFGFISLSQRDLFLQLIKVNGIGPKQAIRILGSADNSLICAAIEEENSTLLAKVPGVGAKTAAKIILALKGKLTKVNDSNTKEISANEDIILALVEMGFARKEVEKVVAIKEKELSPLYSGQKLEDEVFKLAIVELSR